MNKNFKRTVYLDHAATTPTDPTVVKKMQPYFFDNFGNPSALYDLGRRGLAAISQSRKIIADFLACSPAEIIFTSGGTESDNLGILGVARANRQHGNHLITTKIEHHAVLNACEQLQKEGFEITYLDVDQDGLVCPEQVFESLTDKTILVSVMFANNEIGTIEPIAEIGKVLRKYNQENRILKNHSRILFHTDACQAAGALNLDVNRLHVDLLTLNGSKIYGPKGSGILFKKRDVKIIPLVFGGGQEFGWRSGTENVPAIVGLAEALKLAQAGKEKENARLKQLRNYLWKEIQKKITKVKLNGHLEKRLPNNLNISILDVEGEAILLYLDESGIQAATGSACDSQALEPSHVLLAIGLPYEFAHGSLRLTLGHSSKKEDLDYVLKVLPEVVKKLRELSPVKLDLQKSASQHPKYKKTKKYV